MRFHSRIVSLSLFVILLASCLDSTRTSLNRSAQEYLLDWKNGERGSCDVHLHKYFKTSQSITKFPIQNCLELHYLRKDSLSEDVADLIGVQGIELPESLTDIAGIEQMKGLFSLDLYREGKYRATPVDLSPIWSLSSLRYLSINTEAYIGDDAFDGVSKLSELETLQLGWPYQKLPELSGLTKLKNLYMHGDGPLDLDGINELPRLEYLYLSSRGGDLDLTGLSNASDLKELDLSCTSISDLAPIATLSNLRRLRLSCSTFGEIPALARLINLVEIDISETDVEDISSLAGLQRLTHLSIADTNVRDLSPLKTLTTLEYLDMEGLEHLDLSPLLKLRNLKNVSGVWEDADAAQFEKLKASGVPFTDLQYEY